MRILLSSMLLLIAPHISMLAQPVTQRVYLSGTDKDHTVKWKFFCTAGRNSGSWKEIDVPSCWETKGFGTYHYGWAEDFKKNESGLYQFTFNTRPDWRNKTIRIVFEGSMTDTEVKINGKLAGEKHQGSFYRFKYDITKLIRDTNLLEVKVDKISSDTSVNRAERMSDFWVFGGIHRPVYLEIVPRQFIDWTAIDARADGNFTIVVYPQGLSNVNEVEAQIFTLDGTPVGGVFRSAIRQKQGSVTLTTKLESPSLWNPESPNRYYVEVRLKNSSGVVHAVKEKFGFRTVEFREGDGFYVNDRKVMFKGVNRHSFWPTTGRTTSKDISILDVNLIKDMNMNAVRMSHYPPDDHFLDVCDSLGLFVLDELTGWQKKYDTPVGKKLLKEMIMKDVNHPSIIIWDNGNEGGNNHDLVADYHIYDPQKRKVIHPWNIFQGTDTQHYRGHGCCVGSLYNGSNVFFPTEVLHGLFDGGHGAGLHDHWELMKSKPLSAGAFLWVFADEGIVREDQNNRIDVVGNKAPDGIVGPYREKEGSFFAIKEIWSPIVISESKLVNKFNGTLSVHNEYLYTNLDKIKFEYRLTKLPQPSEGTSEQVLIDRGNFDGPSIPPDEYGSLHIPVTSEKLKAADVLYLKAIDAFGREVLTWSWPLKSIKEINREIFQVPGTQARAVEDGNSISVSAGDVTITFDKHSGVITKVENTKGTISLTNGPRLAIGRANVKSTKHYPEQRNYVIEVDIEGEFKKLKYTMLANGILKIDYAYSLYSMSEVRTFDFMGISFDYPEEKVLGVRYAGRGPYRVWKNRMKGNTLGVWTKKYNNTVTGESWDYPEFKGYYRDFNWVVFETKEQPFTIFTESENLFLQLYTPEKPKGATNDYTSPPFPNGSISVLHAISAIGTKFDSAENHGPESMKNKIAWEVIPGTVYFDFRSQ